MRINHRPRNPAAGRRTGLTMIELMIAVTIASVLMVILGNIIISTTHSVDTLTVDTVSDQELKRSMGRLIGELQTVSPTALSINSADANNDAVILQTPGPYTSGTVNWGAVDTQGTWRDDWTAQYLVVDHRLIRRVFNDSGNQIGNDELLARDLDLRSGVNKGFSVSRTGNVVKVSLRVHKTFRDSKDYRKSYESSVLLRNA
jgi:prepilin-type N-terminal cleavage/methylation domain-containing protein